MDEINLIRSFILLTAGIIAIVFPKKIIRFQLWFFKKFNKKYHDNERTLRFFGIFCLIISFILFVYSINQ
jgi:uncharacterized membrane protein